MEFTVNLDPQAAHPLHQQLYQELRRSILTGRLSAGQRLPSTRALAKTLGDQFYAMRDRVQPNYRHLEEALEEALAFPQQPVVLADVAISD